MSASELAPGVEIASRFRLTRELGEGGMGVVWAAERLGDGAGEEVALKFVREDSRSADVLRRFLREARALSKIDHPNVIRVHEVVERDDGWPVMVMPLLVGETLHARLLRESTIPLGQGARILLQVVSAVEAAHAVGIVHRDLKPENVFLVSDAQDGCDVRVLDFGIAKLTGRDQQATATGLTRTGAMIGTPCYMAPEQVFGETDIDARADIWAIGMIAYQCLSGVLPTKADNVGQVLKIIVTKPIFPLGDIAPELPEDLTAVVSRMLTTNRDERLADLAPVREVLAKHADSAPERAKQAPTIRTPLVDVDSDTLEAPAPKRPPAPESDAQSVSPAALTLGQGAAPSTSRVRTTASRSRRRRGAEVGVVAAVALGIGGASWALLRSPSTPAEPKLAAAVLADPASTLACPPLEASGVEAPAGWLGAAAADLACRRATWILGGRVARTRVPAELLDLPRLPAEDYPTDPYGTPDARARALSVAKTSCSAWLDGKVAKDRDEFAISLELRSATQLLAAGTGRAQALHTAVAQALDALTQAGALPRASSIDPETTHWLFVRDVETGLLFDDLDIARNTVEAEARGPCDALEKRRAALGPMFATVVRLCRPIVTWKDSAVPLDDKDPPAAALTAPNVENARDDAALALLDRLGAWRRDEKSPLGVAQLAKGQASLSLARAELDKARAVLLNALREYPRDAELWFFLDAAVENTASVLPAFAAWAPGVADPWLVLAARGDLDRPETVSFFRRAYDLAGRDSKYGVQLGRALILKGRREEGRAIAARYEGGGPNDALAGEYLFALAEMGEGKLGKALARLRSALDAAPSFGESWNAYYATIALWELARVVGKTQEACDGWARRFILSTPPRLDLPMSSPSLWMPAALMCMAASQETSAACFETLDRLVGRGDLPESDESRALLTGAKAFAKRDGAAAVKAWRVLLETSWARYLPAEEFDRVGEDAIAARIDSRALGDRFLHGVSPAHAREALRAKKAGDAVRAKQLAQEVLDAWSTADVEVPSVRAMRDIVRK